MIMAWCGYALRLVCFSVLEISSPSLSSPFSSHEHMVWAVFHALHVTTSTKSFLFPPALMLHLLHGKNLLLEKQT